jgi:hypothetical protein
MSYSPTTNNSTASQKPYSMLTELSTTSCQWGAEENPGEVGQSGQAVDQAGQEEGRRKSVEDITVRSAASSLKKNVTSVMRVKSVGKVDMGKQTAVPKSINTITQSMTPKYLHYNIWDPDSDFTPNTSSWTESAEPLCCLPQSELDDVLVTKTIQENPALFQIITPVNVDVLEAYLVTPESGIRVVSMHWFPGGILALGKQAKVRLPHYSQQIQASSVR